MHLKQWLAAAILMGASAGWAQTFVEPADWVEEDAPPAPAFAKDQLIPVDMPPHVSVKVGLDPNTLSIGGDGVVRYVVVMTNSTGTTNASYEGIRCATDEVKTYARFSANGEWRPVTTPRWQGINDNLPSKHALAIARQGGCEGHMATSKGQMIKALKSKSRPPLLGSGAAAY